MKNCHAGESVSVIKHTDAVPDLRAVNQDKKNMLFSVSLFSYSYIISYIIVILQCNVYLKMILLDLV